MTAHRGQVVERMQLASGFCIARSQYTGVSAGREIGQCISDWRGSLRIGQFRRLVAVVHGVPELLAEVIDMPIGRPWRKSKWHRKERNGVVARKYRLRGGSRFQKG
jgi:hypothetical protein